MGYAEKYAEKNGPVYVNMYAKLNTHLHMYANVHMQFEIYFTLLYVLFCFNLLFVFVTHSAVNSLTMIVGPNDDVCMCVCVVHSCIK